MHSELACCVFFLPVFMCMQASIQVQKRACPTIEIHSRTEGAENFANCSVIEGHMSILRFDDFPPWLKFSELVEITDYLFFYRVSGLSTLRHVFPKLAVIRGRQLFHSYALVVYEMLSLEELGLVNLMTIVRGAVRLEKNPQLCYVNTIDWSLIMNSPIEGNFFLENRADVFCTSLDDCNMNCPLRHQYYSDSFIRMAHAAQEVMHTSRLCWNNEHCQKVCPHQCGSRCCQKEVNGGGECCNDQCLGGCSGVLASQCTACLNVFHNGTCMSHCPQDMYKFVSRRCLTAAECVAMDGWKLVDTGDMRECVDECPPGYAEHYDNKNRSVCLYCGSQCVVECREMVVDSIEAAERLTGCTVIRGVLEILLHTKVDHTSILAKSLGSIQVITDYLVVKGTLLESISFLHNLTTIKGEHLYYDRYALAVRDNTMLQHMWEDPTSLSLNVERGRASFQNNRRLCSSEINLFLEHTGLANMSQEGDIGGNRLDCGLTTDLQLVVMDTSDSSVTVQWNKTTRNYRHNIIGWVVHTGVTSDYEVNHLRVDSCGSGGWRAHDMVYSDDGGDLTVTLTITDLQPFTLYAAYMQAFFTLFVTTSATSPVVFFKTKPSVPTVPRDVKVTTIGVNELTIAWRPPRQPNGDSVYYMYSWTALAWNAAAYEQRNYCENKLHIPSSTTTKVDIDAAVPEVAVLPTEGTCDGQCCATCPLSEQEKQHVESERYFYADMETLLYEFTSVSSIEDVDVDVESTIKNGVSTWSIRDAYEHDRGELNVTKEKQVGGMRSNVTTLLQAHITGLRHFQDYLIEVSACQGNISAGDEGSPNVCSRAALLMARTAPHRDADIVDTNSLSVSSVSVTDDSLLVSWMEPTLFNGIILSYDVEVEHTENNGKQLFCIQATELRERGGININLLHGHYSARVRCTSVAGSGSWTSPIHFLVAVPKWSSWWPTVAICVGVLLSIALCVVALACCLFKRHDSGYVVAASANPIYYSFDASALCNVTEEWEIPREKVTLTRELGHGSFGIVYEGVVCEAAPARQNYHVPTAAAIKLVNEQASSEEKTQLLAEAMFMTQLDCHHVVCLLGIVSKSQPTLVIMELMSGGDLKTYLQHRRPDSEEFVGEPPPQLSDILQMAAEIADGMAYLAAKKYVHRDLAARNCMVSEEGVVKIGDFGLSRDIHQADYYQIGQHKYGRRLPIRWMAPESITDQKFSSQSDVWSLGIVLWEIATLGAQPYRGLSNEEVINIVGQRRGCLDKPLGCSEPLYELMLMCWRQQPKDRPTFCEIIEILVPYLQPDFRDVSFFFSRENQELMAASRHNQASTIMLDFSSCLRTDVCLAPVECYQL